MKSHGLGRKTLILSLGGFLATAVTYGPARMGFGLFLPEFRRQFDMSTEVAGFVASGAFFGFFLALPLALALTSRLSPRAAVVTGGLLAFAGMALVAVSSNIAMLAAGIVMAASSAGFSWTPYNNAVSRMVSENHRPHVLSAISTGTTVGIAGAGLVAMLMAYSSFSWRVPWGVFAAGGLAMIGINLYGLRDGADDSAVSAADMCLGQSKFRTLITPRVLPPYLAALSFGATSAIYLSFAADRVAAAGGLAGLPKQASAPVIFIAFGLVGFLGLIAGRLEKQLGLVFLLRAIFLCSALSLALIAWAPNSWSGVLISAGLQGGCVMMISAVLAFWSLRLFPALPSFAFTATILVVSAGNVVGPALAGLASSRFGADVTFWSACAVSLVTALKLSPEFVRQKPRTPF